MGMSAIQERFTTCKNDFCSCKCVFNCDLHLPQGLGYRSQPHFASDGAKVSEAYATEACGSLLQFRVYPPTSRLPRNCTWGLAQADRLVSSHLHIRLLPPRQPPIARQSNAATNTTAERRVGVRVARNVFKATGSVRLGRVQLAFCTENHLPRPLQVAPPLVCIPRSQGRVGCLIECTILNIDVLEKHHTVGVANRAGYNHMNNCCPNSQSVGGSTIP